MSEGAAARLAAHYALVDVLAQSDSVEDATQRLLAIVGEYFGWGVGALWLSDAAGERLEWVDQWLAPGEHQEAWIDASRRLHFARGEGLPGRVWDIGQPMWVDDFTAGGLPRSPLAAASGLRAAIAFPIHGRHRVLGVMEFLAPEVREPDPAMLDLMRTFGRQVGQFIERRRAEDRLRASQEITSAIVAASLDAVITMDADGRVVDFNPAAEDIFGYAREDAVGRELAALIIPPDLREAHRTAFRRFLETGEGRILDQRLELSAVRADGAEFPVELTVTAIGTRSQPMFAGFVRDIGSRVRAEEELERLLEREHAARRRAEIAERASASIARTLAQSLLPPHLPALPNVELGAAFQPAGQGEVGGDFYDVFESAPSATWACVIGDVCGKGARAAASTALARYTIRAAAIRESRPSQILRLLNEAFLQHGEDSNFCTVAYACLAPEGDGVDGKLCVAGHPLPLILRADGSVESTGAPGTLVGIVPEPVLVDTRMRLGRGDAIVFFTDGVTEARIDGALFGTERLIDLLVSCAGLDAGAIARRVHAAVVPEDGITRDDVAVLVARVRPEGEPPAPAL